MLLMKVGKVGSAHREKQILTQLDGCKFVIELKKTFKDDENLYYVFEYCPYGTIVELAEKFPDERLPISMAAYYTA